ncbi:MAG: hypothetical protein AAF989_04825 [Planctomycetota bacterium]
MANDDWPDDPIARRNAIQLELDRVRGEATVARLEVRVAELEALLATIPPTRFESWDQVRAAQRGDIPEASAAAAPGQRRRIDSGHRRTRRPRFAEVVSDADHECDASSDPREVDAGGNRGGAEFPFSESSANSSCPPISDPDSSPGSQNDSVRHEESSSVRRINATDVKDSLQLDDLPLRTDGDVGHVSRRGIPILLSALLHLMILVVLGWLTLAAAQPKDQIELTCATHPASESDLESFVIETEIPVLETLEASAQETEFDLSPIGAIYASQLRAEGLGTVPTGHPQAKDWSMDKLTASRLSGGPADEAIEFCGIRGGGNHFVYLVDSSKSMGDAFIAARLELLRSIESLRQDQRFYIIFFDAEPDFMRLASPNLNEPASVLATPKNKQLARQWAMRVAPNRGKAPYDPLAFALKLKPDAIFLLSDGEFPERIVDLLTEQNRVENLFGDVKHVSMIHTIGYHSRVGEDRMSQIARENGGQYRHVPEPNAARSSLGR